MPLNVVLPATDKVPEPVVAILPVVLIPILFASLLPVTVASLGVPIKRGSPIEIIKSILSEEVNALENVRVLPDTVNEEPGF